MDLGLSGRVALVAAGSKGLGRAVADELAAEGAAVAICARGAASLDEAVSTIVAAGGRAHGIAADVSQPGEPARVVADAERVFGRVDILVTNAGGPRAATFDALTGDDWAQAVRLLLDSAVAFARAAVPGMRARRWGRILNITSIAAKQPVDGLMLSNSVRAAVIGFARTLATEVAPFGVTVNNLLPGFTRTERMVELSQITAAKEGVTPEQALARFTAAVPMGRMGEPREFAALAAFLASERASYITGQSMAVDGGWIRSLL